MFKLNYSIMKPLLVLFFLLNISNTEIFAQSKLNKFPLFKIGIKINKPSNYYLLTQDNLRELKDKMLSIVDICGNSKSALGASFQNNNYQAIMNDSNYNSITTFMKYPKFHFDNSLTTELEEIIKKRCYSIKDGSIETLSNNSGVCPIGHFISLLNKVRYDNITYYSEAFFIESRNSNITIIINSNKIISNQDFINNVEYINSEEYDILLEKTNSLTWSKNYNSALDIITTAINSQPQNPLGYEKRIALNLKLNKYEDAMKDANKILEIENTSINGLILKGLSYYKQKIYDKAIENFNEAKINYSISYFINRQNDYYSSFAEIYSLIGESYMRQENSKSAIENLQKALDLSEDSLNIANINYDLGLIYSSMLFNYTVGNDYFEKAITYYPKINKNQISESYYNMGLCKSYKKEYKNAILDFSQSIKLVSDNPKSLNNRGYCRFMLDDNKKAIIDFTEVIKLDKNKTEYTNMALGNRGLAKLNLGQDFCIDLKKAIELGNKDVVKIYNQYCK